MPNVTLTISTPVLGVGEVFRTRYRLLPNGAYTSNVDRDNNPFTLVGLSAGQYEMEVIHVLADGTVCEAIIKPFEVVADYTCQIFTPVIVQNGQLFNLQITYGTVTNPPCGFHIKITGATTNKIVNYSPLPASPLLIPVANEQLQVEVIADLCNQKTKHCLDTIVNPIEPTCTPMILSSATILLNTTYPGGSKGFTITLNYTQSVPVSQYVTLYCIQTNALGGAPGIVNLSNPGYGPIAGGATSLSFGIIGNPNVYENTYNFSGYIIDICGKKHTFTVSIFAP